MSAWITHLGRRQVAKPRVGAFQWGLLNDSVSAIPVGHVVGSDAILSVESASGICKTSNWIFQYSPRAYETSFNYNLSYDLRQLTSLNLFVKEFVKLYDW